MTKTVHAPLRVVSITPYDLRYIENAEGETVCDFYIKQGDETKPDFHRFNNAAYYANLFAAAPELMETMQRARTYFATLFEIMDIDEDTTSIGLDHPTKGAFHVSIADVFKDMDSAIAKAEGL